MPRQSWEQTLAVASADGTAITNSTTQGSIIPTAAKFVLPANFLEVGSQLKLTASGRISNVVTTPGTLLFQVLFGAAGVFSPAAFNLNTTAKTNVGWWLDILLTCRSVGSGTSATMLGQGTFSSESVVGSAAGVSGTVSLPASAPAVGTGFDSTASQAVDLQAKFSIANAANSIQLHQFALESRN